MSIFPVPVIHPQLYTRHVLEPWEYKWNAANEDFDRVCYQPIQIMEPQNNPAPNVNGLNRYPSHPIRLEDMSEATIERLTPERVIRRPEPPPRPPPPVFGRRGKDSSNPVVVDSPAETSHLHVAESPASPDPSPPTSPVNMPTKRPAPSPPVSPSRVRCDSPRYIPLQNHQF